MTDILGSDLGEGKAGMDDILSSTELGNGRSLCVASLARDTVTDSGAEHLGFDGFFVFEVSEAPEDRGIFVLGKTASFEAALRLADLLAGRAKPAAA